jgi:Raf kinase inhibitor-like YbhB/YbcL family protein
MQLTSSVFDNGEPIPRQYGYTADNVNPPLRVAGVPASAASLALIMDDPDAVEPAGKIWTHWLIWNIDPAVSEIPEDWGAVGATEGDNDYGETDYGGPNPPDGRHTYRCQLYALDTTLSLPAGASEDELENDIEGHIVAETVLEGTYAP